MSGTLRARQRVVLNQYLNMPIEERILIWKSISITNEKGCWLFQGGGQKGYARVGHEGRNHRLHVLMWKHVNQCDLPEGKQLHHDCHNKNCWNPEHVKPLTPQEHFAIHGPRRTRKTHCANGHEISPENTYYYENGHRRCKVCHRERTGLNRLTLEGLQAEIDALRDEVEELRGMLP